MGAGRPSGFTFTERPGEVVIDHHGRRATTLRGAAANRFIDQISTLSDDAAQDLMARATGNYKHGNERAARSHPRNQGR